MTYLNITAGDAVRLKRHGPYPACTAKAVQRVIELRNGTHGLEVRIQRRHRGRLVACWIGVEWVQRVLPKHEAIIEDACPLQPRTKRSADEMFSRGWCRLCRENKSCEQFQKRVRGQP